MGAGRQRLGSGRRTTGAIYGGGIEQWLITTDEQREVSPFQEQYVPAERQLPPADLTAVDAIVIHLHAEDQLLISDSHD